MRDFFKIKKDVEDEIKNNVRHIAFYADNLTKDEALTVNNFLKEASYKYNINYHICNIQNILHDNTNFYAAYAPKKNCIGWMAVELTNILFCDEVWIFDNGYDNYELNSRLDNVLTQCKKTVRFLAKTPDNKSWDFYKVRNVIHDSNNNIQNNYCLIVDNCEILYPKQKIAGPNNIRALSRTVLSDQEYQIAYNALQLIQFMGNISLKASVRNDDNLLKKINILLKKSHKILLGILDKNQCDNATLQSYQEKLDSIDVSLKKLINRYNL